MTALLALDRVTVRRGERTVLADACLALHAGERLALVGTNGAGKTTLLRTLVGLERHDAGRVIAFGNDRTQERDFREVRRRVGFLFQDPDDQLFCPTVLEDVSFGPLNLGQGRGEAVRTAGAALNRLGLAALAGRITHALSGGEKRLVALAGVLAMDPAVLLLDEPTNALDEAHRARMIACLQSLDAAMIIVSHDRPLLEALATRAVLLAEGRITPALIHRHERVARGAHIHGLGDCGPDADHRHAGTGD